ncbi:MAG TPA: alpha/beta hydrolase [Terriglobales bacterium]|nr:alpha/beta hydrolase [Terriglobales bacterium]
MGVSRLLLFFAIATSTGCSGGQALRPAAIATAAWSQNDVVYSSPGGDDLLADIDVPAGAGPHPGVLLVHGGAWGYGHRWHMNRIADRLVAHGYTVVNIAYRLAPRHRYPLPLHDCRAAVRWMRANATALRLDPERIAGFGYSAGGHLIALLALGGAQLAVEAEAPSLAVPVSPQLQAAVLGAAPSDLNALPETWLVKFIVGRFLGGAATELAEIYAEASPIHHVNTGDPPLFLYHGAADWIVPIEQSRALAAALAQAGVPHRLHRGDLGHLTTFFFDDAALDAAIGFLDRWVKRR